MSDDTETLRKFITGGSAIQSDLLAALDRLVVDRDSLRKALDDRHAADKKAWSAIMRATGKERGIPPNKEVVAWHVAEVERLEKEIARLRARLFPDDCPPADQERDHLAGQCETLGRENESLRAKLDRAKEVLEVNMWWVRGALDCKTWGWDGDQRESAEHCYSKGQAVLSELSADAPAPRREETRPMGWMLWGDCRLPDGFCYGGEPAKIVVDGGDAAQQTQISDKVRGFFFKRYVNGVRMAEDVRIERADTLDEAIPKAASLCQESANTVLVYSPIDDPASAVREAMVEAEKALERLASTSENFLSRVNPHNMAEGDAQQWQSAYDQATVFAPRALAKLRSVMK